MEILSDVAEGAGSPLELCYLRDVERRHGLPPSRRRRRSADRSARRDVRYERYALLVELDGRLGHAGAGAFRDMRRDNAALLTRLATARCGHGDVAGRPCVVALEVAQLFMDRGWGGPFRWCPRCPTRVG